ncbi:hypothetical protein [Streptomyces luteolus]|uniref:Uncharacterized protein n=1 Tax=Streptomyces luteolus TaxID=3043615 RepID=A0ABT6SY18_9ACTN|nr:hypothetical protein [Streptomyces sp. B-S-A12]MDI3420008.1 hypothetical protein [Streptomyces sp. B-S-A12]
MSPSICGAACAARLLVPATLEAALGRCFSIPDPSGRDSWVDLDPD